MLNRAGLLVLVDGYNVSMEGWPAQNIADQRRSLISVLGHLQTRSAAEIQVVFDGAFAESVRWSMRRFR
ncbi:MAG: NYN domain-containing protein [Microthrixaceae bacterium]